MELRIVVYKIILFNVKALTFLFKCNGICAKTCKKKNLHKKRASIVIWIKVHICSWS